MIIRSILDILFTLFYISEKRFFSSENPRNLVVKIHKIMKISLHDIVSGTHSKFNIQNQNIIFIFIHQIQSVEPATGLFHIYIYRFACSMVTF